MEDIRGVDERIYLPVMTGGKLPAYGGSLLGRYRETA